MENNISVKITEEVIRQSVEVRFKKSDLWEISFTNPTAGPWKVITIGDYEGGHDLRYDKEEDRPDLILFDHKSCSFIIFEAKDDLSKMFSKNQISKSVNVFVKERDKLTNIIESGNKADILGSRDRGYNFYFGYIYSRIDESDEYISSKRRDLISLHKSELSGTDLTESTVHIIVGEEGNTLIPRHKLFDFDSGEVSRLRNRLPTKRET